MRAPAAAVGALGVLVAAAFALIPRDLTGPCSIAHDSVNLPGLPEVSGLAVSRRHPGIVWAHNDSGNEPVLFGVDAAGAVRARVRLPVHARDWEDIANAPCVSGDCLYAADIGDNEQARRRIRIYRVPEPALDDTETGPPEALTLVYPDGPHNAEALFAAGMHLYVITRDRVGALYRFPVPGPGTHDITLVRVGELGVEAISDAEASLNERMVAVRTPNVLLFYRATDLHGGGQPQPFVRVPLHVLNEPQGEGIALGPGGMVYLASEGRPWHRAGRLVALRCSVSE